MITCAAITDGKNYLGAHLRKNDYWKEGEKQVSGVWYGQASELLGLKGPVEDEQFEALRVNRDPRTFDAATGTGDKLTPRDKADRRAYTDIQLSAPKDVSVLAIVGDDARVEDAFRESVKVALREMEQFAAVRQRDGANAHSDKRRLTGNMCSALFFHDSSRDLDPQLHAHSVTANVTWDVEKGQFMALDASEMMRASGYARKVLYQELAKRLQVLGYKTHSHDENGFFVTGVEHLRERFSKRSATVAKLSAQFENGAGRPPSPAEAKQWEEILSGLGFKGNEVGRAFEVGVGRPPTPGEVALLVKHSRADKLAEISTSEVRSRQKAQLSDVEYQALSALVENAKGERSPTPLISTPAREALEKAIEHVFERKSVAHAGEIMASALALAPAFVDPQELRKAFNEHADIVSRGAELTLRSIIREERDILRLARESRDVCHRLGEQSVIEEKIGPDFTDQRLAGSQLAASTDGISLLIGDAGTGKTFLLKTVRDAHVATGGQNWVALAPTGKARDELQKEGFGSAATVQRYLVDEGFQLNARGKVLLVDEAGMLSTPQLGKLLRIAERNNNRVILVGDTKQHEAVERGNALRLLIDEGHLPVSRLTTVKRQRSAEHKRLSETLATGQLAQGLDLALSLGMVVEEKDPRQLIINAAEAYTAATMAGKDVLAVCPVWAEIAEFNHQTRERLKERGHVSGPELTRNGLASKSWTAAEKASWQLYKPNMIVTFHKKTSQFKVGEAGVVVGVEKNGVLVQREKGDIVKVTRKHRNAFDVSESVQLQFAAGDKILFRGNCKRVANTGDVVVVKSVDTETGSILLANGNTLPNSFGHICHGYAVTSHKSQGATVDESMLIMGPRSLASATAEQWYVSNTRYRSNHRVYASNVKQLRHKLQARVRRREGGSDFLRRSAPSTPRQCHQIIASAKRMAKRTAALLKQGGARVTALSAARKASHRMIGKTRQILKRITAAAQRRYGNRRTETHRANRERES